MSRLYVVKGPEVFSPGLFRGGTRLSQSPDHGRVHPVQVRAAGEAPPDPGEGHRPFFKGQIMDKIKHIGSLSGVKHNI